MRKDAVSAGSLGGEEGHVRIVVTRGGGSSSEGSPGFRWLAPPAEGSPSLAPPPWSSPHRHGNPARRSIVPVRRRPAVRPSHREATDRGPRWVRCRGRSACGSRGSRGRMDRGARARPRGARRGGVGVGCRQMRAGRPGSVRPRPLPRSLRVAARPTTRESRPERGWPTGRLFPWRAVSGRCPPLPTWERRDP